MSLVINGNNSNDRYYEKLQFELEMDPPAAEVTTITSSEEMGPPAAKVTTITSSDPRDFSQIVNTKRGPTMEQISQIFQHLSHRHSHSHCKSIYCVSNDGRAEVSVTIDSVIQAPAEKTTAVGLALLMGSAITQ